MEVSFFSSLEAAHNQVNDCLSNLLEYIDDEKLKEKSIKDLEKILVSCITCEHKVAISRQAVKETLARVQGEESMGSNSELFDDLVEESIGELEMDSPLEDALTQAPSLKIFREMQEKHNANTGNFEDLMTTEYSHSLIDPISKKRMKDPVRNKHCDHVYDRSTVTAMITAKSKHVFKCPTMGCSNRQAMKLSDLVDAADVRRELLRQEKS